MATFQTLEKTIYVIAYLIKKLFSMFEMWPFTSIWLEISINWYTKSQGPKNKCINFTKGGFTPAPLTLLGIRVVLLQKQAIEQRFSSLTVYSSGIFDMFTLHLTITIDKIGRGYLIALRSKWFIERVQVCSLKPQKLATYFHIN